MYKSIKIFLIFLASIYMECAVYEKVTFLAAEHATVTSFNRKYASAVSASARRYSRSDPVYYFNLNITSLLYVGNNVSVDFYFYEWLTNQYKRSFVEMHFKMCNLVKKNVFFGSTMNKALNDMPCPYPPGRYVLENMTVPSEAIPRTFPFTKGRIVLNVTFATGEHMGSGYVDFELRTMKRKIVKNN